VKCPTCDRPILWNADFPARPFCSERCRLIDLGAWLSGDRAIPGEPVDPDELPPVDPGTADEREPPRGPGLRDETRGRSPQGSRRR
jgi:endogenous inhibitor of DNA gyrase (YacG/DUF329 family)